MAVDVRIPLASAEGVDSATFRQGLGRCATGVVVVTVAGGPEEPAGMTVTSFTSVSLTPPLVALYVDHAARCGPRLRRSEWFIVNVLADTQAAVAARFAAPGVDRFAPPTSWRRGPHGTLFLGGAAAYLCCRTREVITLGDHFLLVGLVTDVVGGTSEPPLLYYAGGYGRFRPVAAPDWTSPRAGREPER